MLSSRNSKTGVAARYLAIAACFLALPDMAAGAEPARYMSGFTQTRAIIETSNERCVVLRLYLADTSEQHRQGLMFIEKMDEDEGMLFRYGREIPINMWMKNTYIPLDMVFLDRQGRVTSIARNTKPMTTTRISSTKPVPYVLELNAGAAERWQFNTGNRLLVIN